MSSSSVPFDRYMTSLDHEEVLVRRGPRSGLYSIIAVHSTARGPSLGGCRVLRYDDHRLALRDALRLSRAMTWKSAVAGLRLGGGKGVLACRDPARLTGRARRDALIDFGEAVEQLDGRYITAEDVGTSARDIATIASATSHVTGLSRARGGSGDPSPWTALGVFETIRASVERTFGSPDLRGRSVALIGLGHVGLPLARLLAKAGAKLLVADIDRARKADATALGARWVGGDKAFSSPVDVLAPCALGGILDHDSVELVQAPVIAGAANNQLADDHVAGLLADRGILWAPDFVANAGGIVNISVELRSEGYDPKVARALVRGIGDTMRRVYDDADRAGVTPLAAAMALAHRRVADGVSSPV
ncbi:Glu/Leu/Phe/Val dehydrogenase [Paraconexibacter sp.]|uniref:Glu/Leu/Phe/Val family dehydrogenase n=1 Tax=Paraconexibacter sp. TaxID=2949640 RepID=UPI003564618C